VFMIDIVFLVCRLIAVILFFMYTTINFRLPFNLFREGLSTIRMLYKKVTQYMAYLRITRELEKLPDTQSDSSGCPICFGEMDVGKRIPCGHVFHGECLRQWVEGSEYCPICRRGMFRDVVFESGDERVTGVEIEYDE